MNREFNLNQLASAVMWWLSYTSAVGRNYVLSEGSIRFPVAEYLERSSVEDIELEFGHPKLLRKRFDLYFKQILGDKTAFEFKYIKDGSTRTYDEKQRIFNDLMRLYLFLQSQQKGFFLISGNQNDFVKDFQRIKQDPILVNGKMQQSITTLATQQKNIIADGFYTKWFSFDVNNPIKTIDLNSDEEPYKKIYAEFFNEYAMAHLKKAKTVLNKPAEIKTKLKFLSGNMEQPIALFQPAKIGIWEVLA